MRSNHDPELRVRALQAALATRQEVKALKESIAAGEVDLAALLEDPPTCIARWALIDVVRLGWPSSNRNRASASFEGLGREAAHAGINLLIPTHKASTDTCRWVVLHVRWSAWKNGRGEQHDIVVGRLA